VAEHAGVAAPALALLAGLAGYSGLVLLPRGRRPWPGRRTAAWYAGLGAVGLAALGPLGHGFAGHVAAHVLAGMAAPLLVCWAMPVTLALRNLPARAARRLARLLRRAPVRVVAHPVTALVLNAGGLWLLYATPLYGVLGGSPLVHVHMFLAGCLLTAALAGPDPAPHRASWPVRAAVLVLFMAAHATLAKFLYAHPPAGVAPPDAQRGAMLMYYAGDAADLVLLVLLFRSRRSLRPVLRQRPRAGRPADNQRAFKLEPQQEHR
jgi:putative membrane protein